MSQDVVTSPPSTSGARVGLPSIFIVFFKLGAFSFGGGLTGWVYQEVVAIRRWMSEEELLSGLALCQVLPGANVTNLSVFVGLKLRGIIGATVAVGALLTAPFLAVISFALIYDRIASLAWLSPAMDGISAAATGLLLVVGLKSSARAVGKLAPMLALAATAVMVGILQWPLLPVVLCVAPVSIWAAWPRKSRDA